MDESTLVLTASVIGLAVVVVIVYLINRGRQNPDFGKVAPALMVSVGILGTFIGISIVLFNVSPSANSSPDTVNLLNGMKLAFVTSCIGLAASIGYRIIWYKPEDKGPTTGEKDIVLELVKLRESFSKENSNNLMYLQNILQINTEGFKQLDGLSETIKTALIDNLKHLIAEIQAVMRDELAKSLRELLETINETINNTLGEKLDEFNASVDQMRNWQLENREQLERVTEAFMTISTGIQQIRKDCETIPQTMNELRSLGILIREEMEDLENRLQAFAGMKDKAEQAFSVIDEKLENMMAAIEEKLAVAITAIEKNLESVMTSLQSSAEGFQNLDDTIKDIHSKAVTQIESMHEKSEELIDRHAVRIESIITQSTERVSNLETVIEKTIENTSKQIELSHERGQERTDAYVMEMNKSMSNMRSEMEKSLHDFTDKLESEMRNVAKKWGGNLVAIAEQCRDVIEETTKNRKDEQSEP